MISYVECNLLVEKLEDLKEFSRKSIKDIPTFLRYKNNFCYQHVWKNFRILQQRILRKAYFYNITLVLEGEEIRFRTLIEQYPHCYNFEIYLKGQYLTLSYNTLIEFIQLHENLNDQIKEIKQDMF